MSQTVVDADFEVIGEPEEPIKGIVVGNSGSGKTASLVSLAEAGYYLHIADFDKGTKIIKNLLQKKNPTAYSRCEIKPYTDVYGGSANIYPTRVQAWSQAMNQMTKWTTAFSKYPECLNHIIVIDSLNFASKFAFNWILSLAGRLMAPKEIQDWGAAQDLMGAFLMKMYSNEVKCHVLMLTHISWQGTGESDIKMGFPMTAVGRSFNPQIGRFFNNVFLVRNTGTGPASKREIWTSPIDWVDLKAESLELKSHYPLATGMADIFKSIRGKTPVIGAVPAQKQIGTTAQVATGGKNA